METFILKTHKIGREYTQPHFFILNKGNNSGKPLNQPCPNCFVCITNSSEEKVQLYWLLYGLWRSKMFYQYLRGSVIPFIVCRDLNACITKAYSMVINDSAGFEKKVKVLQDLETLEAHYKKSLRLVDLAKESVFSKILCTS